MDFIALPWKHSFHSYSLLTTLTGEEEDMERGGYFKGGGRGGSGGYGGGSGCGYGGGRGGGSYGGVGNYGGEEIFTSPGFGWLQGAKVGLYVVGYEKRDHIAQNAIFCYFSTCHHSKIIRAPGFPLSL